MKPPISVPTESRPEQPRATLEQIDARFELMRQYGNAGAWDKPVSCLKRDECECVWHMFIKEWRAARREIRAYAASSSLLPVPTEEGICQDCGREYGVWFAPNEIWNVVIPERVAMLCPICFMTRADHAAISFTGWELRPENFSKLNASNLLEHVRRDWRVGEQQETQNQSSTSPSSKVENPQPLLGTESQQTSPERTEDSSKTLASLPVGESRWISVEEKLPKDFEQVLGYLRPVDYPRSNYSLVWSKRGIWFGMFSDLAGNLKSGEIPEDQVTHWQSLEKPPTPKQSEAIDATR